LIAALGAGRAVHDNHKSEDTQIERAQKVVEFVSYELIKNSFALPLKRGSFRIRGRARGRRVWRGYS
jgi:hypothetical protein